MLLVHYAMISYRLGARNSRSAKKTEQDFPAISALSELFTRSIASPGWWKTTCSDSRVRENRVSSARLKPSRSQLPESRRLPEVRAVLVDVLLRAAAQ